MDLEHPSLLSGQELSNIFVGLAVIGLVVPTLFFFVGSKVESSIVQTQAFYIVDGLTETAKYVLTPAQMQLVHTFFEQHIEIPDMSREDAAIETANSDLLKTAYKAIGVGVLGVLLFVMFAQRRHPFPLKPMFTENLFVGMVVMVIELGILFFIARNYKSAQVNAIKKDMVQAVKSWATANAASTSRRYPGRGL